MPTECQNSDKRSSVCSNTLSPMTHRFIVAGNSCKLVCSWINAAKMRQRYTLSNSFSVLRQEVLRRVLTLSFFRFFERLDALIKLRLYTDCTNSVTKTAKYMCGLGRLAAWHLPGGPVGLGRHVKCRSRSNKIPGFYPGTSWGNIPPKLRKFPQEFQDCLWFLCGWENE